MLDRTGWSFCSWTCENLNNIMSQTTRNLGFRSSIRCCLTSLTWSQKMLKTMTSMFHTKLSMLKHVHRYCLQCDRFRNKMITLYLETYHGQFLPHFFKFKFILHYRVSCQYWSWYVHCSVVCSSVPVYVDSWFLLCTLIKYWGLSCLNLALSNCEEYHIHAMEFLIEICTTVNFNPIYKCTVCIRRNIGV
jgi:hypothetical protein